jgi:hypothetical protein
MATTATRGSCPRRQAASGLVSRGMAVTLSRRCRSSQEGVPGLAPYSAPPKRQGLCDMTEHIGLLARLFRGMADLIDEDRRSLSRYEAIVNAAGIAAARASAEGIVGGRLWDDDGAALLAAAYAFHAGLSRQAVVAVQVRAMEEPSMVKAGEQQHQPHSESVPPGWAGPLHPPARAPDPPAPGSSRPPPVDPPGLPGPRLGELDAAAAAGLWALLAELRRGEVTPRGQLIRLTRRLPVQLAAQLLSLLDGGPALVRAESVRVLEAADPQSPATPALAVVVLGWLEAAEQVLAAAGSAHELQVLLGVAGQEGILG